VLSRGFRLIITAQPVLILQTFTFDSQKCNVRRRPLWCCGRKALHKHCLSFRESFPFRCRRLRTSSRLEILLNSARPCEVRIVLRNKANMKRQESHAGRL
jgi:hypothetical protein